MADTPRPRPVLLMRPEAGNAPVADRLAALGFVPVIAPVTRIVALPATLPTDASDAVLATSAHAFAAGHNLDRLRKLPLLAVGAATAAAARGAGFTDVRTAAGDVQELVDLARLTLPRRARLLYLAGRVRKATLVKALSSDGHTVDVRDLYDTVPIEWVASMVDALRQDPPAAALHFSAESARRGSEQIRRHGLEQVLGSMAHICLSEDVARALPPGISGVHVARGPTVDSLLQALVSSISQP